VVKSQVEPDVLKFCYPLAILKNSRLFFPPSSTVFALVKSIDAIGTSNCFAVIIASTIVMDFLIEHLNEACERFGHV
jgi:hypothetical protein